MKGSTTSSGKMGGMYKDSTHSSQADRVEKWGHDGYDSIIQQEQEHESYPKKKHSEDFSSSSKEETQTT
jgi:hypothetical protein